MNPDIIGCVWTGEFELNTLRVDGEIFESGKKKLRIQKYPDTCGRGLNRDMDIGKILFTLSYVKHKQFDCNLQVNRKSIGNPVI